MAGRFKQSTRAELRQAVGSLRFRKNFLYGNVLASPAPTISSFALLRAKASPDDVYIGKSAYAVTGTGAGQVATISDSAAGTGVLTITPSVSPTFDATTYVEIWPEDSSPDDVNAAINLAIQDAYELVNVRVDITNPTLDSTYKIITLPATLCKIIDVTYLDSGGAWVPFGYSRYANQLTEMWRGFTIRNGGIYLSEPISSSIVGTNIMVRGYRLPNLLTADTDLCEVNPAFVTYMAAFFLEAGLSFGAQLDPEQHSGRAANWLRSALQIREQMGTNWEPGTMEIEV